MPVVNNPIDTPQQRKHELYALELYNSERLRSVRAQVRDYWLDLAKPSATMLSCFDSAFEEVMFGAVIWALNQDPLNPKVITITRLAHETEGQAIPGSRWGIDNPDSVYRVIPISGDEKYIIHGRVSEPRLIENYFTLWDPVMRTVGFLNGKDLQLDKDGRFEIFVDSDEPGGRANHIKTDSSAHEFYIRDVIFDWERDRPNELTIERLGSEVSRRSYEEDIQLAADYMHKWATNTTRWNNQALNKSANDFSFTIDRDTDGALRNQVYIMGHFKLDDPQQLIVLDIDMGGAEYFIAPITNIWGTSNAIVSRNGCLNKHQSTANADGSYTFALSLSDPGIANWLDPTDMDEGILTLRWAEFPNDQAGDSLGVKCRITTLADFQQEVTAGQQISEQQRGKLAEQRAASYQWRLQEQA